MKTDSKVLTNNLEGQATLKKMHRVIFKDG